jgi:RHS repeat-associated protein
MIGVDFQGRYYGSALGRFSSPDPITATPLHIINPQRWNMYAYALNDPLSLTDPDGRDAIAVNFSKQVPVGGHEGFFSVHKDGSAQYASFGPQGGGKPSAPGEVKWAQADFTVEFEPNGIPTQASYKQLAELAAKVEGQDPNTVGLNYFKTSELDTAAQDAWIQRIAEASAKGQGPWYDVARQNCATFCIAGLIQGRAIQNKDLSMTPNLLFELLLNRSADNYSGKDAEKASKSHRNCLIDRSTGNCVN